ncbi:MULTISPECIES: ribosome biogenesis GTPase Der [unclassified Fusibacter]|uniref:ribosome biogenesis GTPase Der n=1 Tax=unclassified Fusibacter TaxID=2624464 RepID=UPI001010F955|nr:MULTISPECIES: ribosome biogenesis GTPase Der [unclassified Fusibacter]MCK8058022.1 ribosome biogenesis GTPase Der [Fusibacter sp. A2]NPE20604.1 ribosome biogenesis GTPase Der [Fusibacter sp. A1]RXV62811.1 ribosome biogenesis GTPase Der [Fusibacter sp. A1]
MRKPIVAVVGRPNVGKSTFFNRISGKRISIVEDTPGVTRDRVYTDVNWLKYNFTMIDTGGIEPDSDDIILSQMRQQALLAVDAADVILFMIDGRADLTSADEDVAEILRRSHKPVILVANKIDTARMPEHFYDYYTLGMGEPIAISSVNGLNLGDLLDEIVSHFKDIVIEDYDEDTTKVAVIGKPNAGKSSLVNNLLGEERVIVSEIAGTTREAIDTPFQLNDKDYVLIDTAGLRRKSRIDENVEKYSMFRALTAIERADVCVLMIDAVEGVTEQDKKVAGYAHEAGKATIILVNKWDLIEKNTKTYQEYTKIVRNELSFMQYAPIEFVSVKSGQRLTRVMEMVDYVNNQAALRVPTGTLNDVISEAILMHQPPSDKGKRLKIYYMTQIGVKPPTFVLFINDEELAHFSYIRYLENHIRKNFNFDGTPIIIKTREKKQ